MLRGRSKHRRIDTASFHVYRCLRKVYINGDRNQNSSHVWLGGSGYTLERAMGSFSGHWKCSASNMNVDYPSEYVCKNSSLKICTGRRM